MSKQILIDSYFGLVRTAIADGASLLDYYEESPEQGRAKGNIYRGIVKKVDAPIQAAFVRFGGGRDGFLPLRDAGSGGRPPKVGDTVLVQVVKDEVGDKGAALTTKLSLSGRYLVFIPERESEGGISARITDEERAALKKVLGELQIPEGGSIILRTAAMNKGTGELQADLDRLTESYREIMDKFSQGKEAGLLFREVPPALRYLREYYGPDVERIWVNQEEVLDQCRQFFYLYEPKSAAKVALSKDGPLMFQKLGLEADVERLNSRKVALPSGANIIIDQAEALVAIDVNSAKAGGRGEDGRKRGDAKGGSEKEHKENREPTDKGRSNRGRANDLEATVFAVNKEAAGEIARQLRLRDLGGIIIVDFIDMEEEKHRRQIEEIMKRALASDKAKVKVYDISPLGIMQISRQRLRKAGPNFSRQGCEPCQGRGWHPSPAAGALTVLRKMEERLQGKKAGQTLMISAPYPVANKLINEFRDHVFSMEKRFGCTLRVTALPSASGEAAFAAQGPGGEGRGETRNDGRQEGRQDGRAQGRNPGKQDTRDARGRRNGADESLVAGTAKRGERQDRPQQSERDEEARAYAAQAEAYHASFLAATESAGEPDAEAGGIHPELIQAFDDLPSHTQDAGSLAAAVTLDFPDAPGSGVASSQREQKPGGTEKIPGRGRARPARGRGRGRVDREPGAKGRDSLSPRGESRDAANAAGAANVAKVEPVKSVESAAKAASDPAAPEREASPRARKPHLRAGQPVRPPRAKAMEVAVKVGEPPAKPLVASKQTTKDDAQSGEIPRRRSRRRSRRGKGGGQGGA